MGCRRDVEDEPPYRLLFARSVRAREFWPALLEKAYPFRPRTPRLLAAACVCVCLWCVVCVCARACARACVCVRALVCDWCVCVCVCVCVCDLCA